MSVRAGESLVLCDIFRGRFLLCAQNRDRRDLGTEDNQAVAGWHSVTQAPAAPGPGALDQVPSLDDISGGLEHSSKSTWEMLDLTSAEKQLHWSQGRKKEFCGFYLCLALLPKYLNSLATQSETRRGGTQERSSSGSHLALAEMCRWPMEKKVWLWRLWDKPHMESRTKTEI